MVINNEKMRKSEILFSIIFLIIAYYMIAEKDFLSQAETRDLVYHSILTLGAISVVINNVIDLRKLGRKEFKYRIISIFCIVSATIFVLVTVFRLFFMLIT